MASDMKPIADDLAGPFAEYLRSNGKEESTIKLYVAEISHFLGWLKRTGTTLAAVTQEDIFASRDELYIKGKRLSTINKYVSILASFFKWAGERGLAKDNPAASARYYAPKKSELPRWLSPEEEAQLLQLADKEKNPFKKARNAALLHVFLYAGVRLDEASELTLGSVKEQELVIWDKGAELRRVPIPEPTRSRLAEWIEQRTLANKAIYKSSDYLFVTERSGSMQPRSIQFVVEGYSRRLGFEFGCHDLRNTYCRRLAAIRTPILLLKRWAGHKSFLTTYQYYAELE